MNILETINQTDIKSIRPIQDERQDWDFTINWMVGKYCNYVCSYCDKSNRDKTSPHLSLDDLKLYWTNAKLAAMEKGFKRIRLILTGGEPTANPNFLEFLEYLHLERQTIEYINVAFITNISQSKEYYLNALNFSNVSFSTHFEYWNENEAMDTILSCHAHVKKNKPLGKVNVMLMLEEAYKDQVEKVKNIFDQEGIRYTVQRIRNTYLAKGIQNKNYKSFDYDQWKQRNGKV